MSKSCLILLSLLALTLSQTQIPTLTSFNLNHVPAGRSFTIESVQNQIAGFSGPIGLGDYNQDGINDLSFYFVNNTVNPNFTSLAIVYGSTDFQSFSLPNAVQGQFTSVGFPSGCQSISYLNSGNFLQNVNSSITFVVECSSEVPPMGYIFPGMQNPPISFSIPGNMPSGTIQISNIYNLTQEVHSTCDFNGDGIADMIFHSYNSQGSSIIILFGPQPPNTNIDISNLPSDRTLLINGTNDYILSYQGVPDMNGDGCDELFVYQSITYNYANTFILFGSKNPTSVFLSNVLPSQGINIMNYVSAMGYYHLPTSIGDFNHDGYNDIMLNAPYGYVYLISGGPSMANINVNTVQPPNGAVFSNLNGGVPFGDFNGDGNFDILLDDNPTIVMLFGFPQLMDLNFNGTLPPLQGLNISYDPTNSLDWLNGIGDINNDGNTDIGAVIGGNLLVVFGGTLENPGLLSTAGGIAGLLISIFAVIGVCCFVAKSRNQKILRVGVMSEGVSLISLKAKLEPSEVEGTRPI